MDIEAKGSTYDARYGLVAIDNFTKVAEVIPIKNRTPESIIAGLKKITGSMRKPKQLYADEESSAKFARNGRILESD